MANGTLQVVDYSFSRIDHAAAMARGVVGAMRYLYGNNKGLTAAEVALFRSSGMCLGLNYEAGSGDFRGHATGVQHAQAANRFANALGLGGHTIIFSADWDVRAAEYASVGDAIEGALSVLGDGNVGIYGHTGLIDYLHGRFGDRIYYWQTYAWSGGRLSVHADLYQFRNGQDLAGGQVDFNQITGRTFWAISHGHTTSGGSAVPLTPKDWFDMATKADLQDAVLTALKTGVGHSLLTDAVHDAVSEPHMLAALAAAVWNQTITLKGLGTDKAASLLANSRLLSGQARDAANGVSKQVTALHGVVGDSAGGDVDPAALATDLANLLGQPLAAELAKHLTLTATVQGA